jgi:uncharacterized protein
VVVAAETFFLDTSVLMYAAGGEHPLRQPCRDALARCVELGVDLVLDAEVLQEVLHRYFSIGRPEVARSVYEAAVGLADEVLLVEERHTARALELLLDHHRSGLTPRDAVHVAVMEMRGLSKVLSTDRHFDTLAQIERVDPAAFSRASG